MPALPPGSRVASRCPASCSGFSARRETGQPLSWPRPAGPRLRPVATAGRALQRAIGLEIEVPIPVDNLTGGQINQIRAAEVAASAAGALPAVVQANRVTAAGIMDQHGHVPGKQVIKAAGVAGRYAARCLRRAVR
jgi:hypothetical protein